jgi:hypothetical protein
MQVTTTTEQITPKKATQYLNQNNSNRKLRDGVAERYANDMVNGNWTVCTAPIAFFEDGDVADGQHRLWAIVESGIPQSFIVMRGVPRDAALNIDTGFNRTLADNARISGHESSITNEMISYARATKIGERNISSQSNAEKLALVEELRESVTWAIQNGPRARGLRNACMMGAIARAYMHEGDRNKLKRFCEVVATGFAESRNESAAVAIRNHMLQNGMQKLSSQMWRETFLKVQNAIRYFMLDKPLTVVRGITEETYPLKGKTRSAAKTIQKRNP